MQKLQDQLAQQEEEIEKLACYLDKANARVALLEMQVGDTEK